MGNSRTSRYADGRTLYDLHHATAHWLRALAGSTRFELEAAHGVAAQGRVAARRLQPLRDALRRLQAPAPVSARRGAGEVQRMLIDPDIAPFVRRLARRRRHDEGDVASLWAQIRVRSMRVATAALPEADAA